LGAAADLVADEADKAVRRREDPVARRELEERLQTAKGWSALGAFDSAERTRALDLFGFERQFVFSTYAAAQFLSKDPAALYTGARVHNRAMAAWCAQDPRLVAVAFVPLDDPSLAADAVDEALAFGCGAIHIPSAPPRDKGPTHPDYDAVWARIADAGVPVLLHLGGQGKIIRSSFHNNGRPVTDFLGGGESARAKDVMGMHMAPEIFVSAMIFDGLFDQHPNLMVGVIEQGAEWVVPWLARLDLVQDLFARTEPALRDLQLRASAYAHRNVRVTPLPGERVGWLIEQAGDDLFMFSSDYPHPEGRRDPVAVFEATMPEVDDIARRKFYRDNMATLCGSKA
jgi:predicted TIM-barrel fold metal-dependent hydrolase